MQSRHTVTIQKRGNKIQRYESSEQSDFHVGQDIAGLDANVLVDLVESDDFKQNIREQVSIGVWKVYTTNVALGEARNVLVKKRNYTKDDATNRLQDMMKEFKVIKIDHNREGNELGNSWLKLVKNKIRIKKFKTFPNDCRILANLFKQSEVNLYFTEDQDIEKAVNVLKVPIRVRIVGEASQLGSFEVKRFFKEQAKERRKASRKHRKHR